MKRALSRRLPPTARVLIAACVVVGLACQSEPIAPGKFAHHVYLTWSRDETATHITVNYHSDGPFDVSQVRYDRVSREGEPPAAYRFHATGEHSTLPGLERRVHHVQISGLEPDTTYYFVTGDDRGGWSPEYKLRTLPLSGPIRFIVGGDMGASEIARELLGIAAAFDPHFVVLGGDVSYAGARRETGLAVWDRWFRMWQEYAVDPDGHLLPISTVVGNHDVRGSWLRSHRERAPFLLAFFKQNSWDGVYFERHFSDHTAIVHLDSEHLERHYTQRDFLADTLRGWAKEEIVNRVAVYHAGLYPSHRGYHTRRAARGRQYWLPLFDEFALDVAFEHHDHALKRTFPLKNDRRAGPGEGTIYVGDGGFGVEPRPVYAERWYLEKAVAAPHFWRVETSRGGLSVEAVTRGGEVLDHFALPVPTPPRATPADAAGKGAVSRSSGPAR